MDASLGSGRLTRAAEDYDALQNGVVSRGLRLHLKIMTTTNHEKLVKLMQATLICGPNSIESALSKSTQEQRSLLARTERDQMDRRREKLPFHYDAEDKPPLAWVILWRGRYSNYHGGIIPPTLKRWGWVFWEWRRLTESRGKDVVKRVWQHRGRG